MKKKLYFDPPKKTSIEEYLTISYGKIRDVHVLQLGAEVPKQILEKDPSLSKDTYLPLKNFHCDYQLRKVDKYLVKQKKLKYNYEIVLPEIKEPLNPHKLKPEFILKGMLNGRRIFIKLNLIEKLILDYQSFSWSSLNTNQRIKIIGIIIASCIPIVIFILSRIFN